jgi:hypothetical protein
MSSPLMNAFHKSSTMEQERILWLAHEVLRLRTILKPQLMAQAFARWDANPAIKADAGSLMQDYSKQYDEDIRIDLPELFGD